MRVEILVLKGGWSSSGKESKGGLGLEKTLENCLLKRLAFCLGSVTHEWFSKRSEMPNCSLRWDFI